MEIKGFVFFLALMKVEVFVYSSVDGSGSIESIFFWFRMSLNKLSSSTLTDTRSSAVTSSNINVAASTAADTALVGDKNVSTASINSTLKTKEKQSKIDVDEANQVISYVEIPSQVASQSLPKGELAEIVVPIEVVGIEVQTM